MRMNDLAAGIAVCLYFSLPACSDDATESQVKPQHAAHTDEEDAGMASKPAAAAAERRNDKADASDAADKMAARDAGHGKEPAADKPDSHGGDKAQPHDGGTGAAASGSDNSDAGAPLSAMKLGSGRLWIAQDFCADNLNGTNVISLGKTDKVKIEATLTDLHTVPHGGWYASRSYSDVDKATKFSVNDTKTWEVLYQNSINGTFLNVHLHPSNNKLIEGLSSAVDNRFVVIDITSNAVVYKIPFESTTAADGTVSRIGQVVAWLPDGRYLRVATNGARFIGSLDGNEEKLPALEIPSGYQLAPDTWVNPAADRHTLRLLRVVDNKVSSSDVWIASFDSSTLSRVTMTNLSSIGLWSPDGSYILFDVDPDFTAGCGDIITLGSTHSNIKYYVTGADHPASADAMPIDKFSGWTLGNNNVLGWTE